MKFLPPAPKAARLSRPVPNSSHLQHHLLFAQGHFGPISVPLSHILVNQGTAAGAKRCFVAAPVPKAICTSTEGGVREGSRYLEAVGAVGGGLSVGKQDGLEQMNGVEPEGCMSFSWSVSKTSY